MAIGAHPFRVNNGGHLVHSNSRVVYSLTAHVCGLDLPNDLPRTTRERHLFFWPNRYTDLVDGTFPNPHSHSLVIPMLKPPVFSGKCERKLIQRLRKTVSMTKKISTINLVTHIPRYAILGQSVQANLSIGRTQAVLHLPHLKLESVKYVLNAITRVGRKTSNSRHIFSDLWLVRHYKDLNISLLDPDGDVSLRTFAPLILPVQASQSIHGAPESLGSLCPTFESELIGRTYTIILYVTISCEGKAQSKRFDGGEIVLLPPRLDENVKKELVTELAEKNVLETDGEDVRNAGLVSSDLYRGLRTEASAGEVAQEVDGDYNQN